MKSIVIKNNHRNLKIKGILEAMSKTPTRSIDDGDWYRYQQLIVRYYDQLWGTNTTEEKRRENFRVKRHPVICLKPGIRKNNISS
jgi:hypothetical protein